MVENDDLRKISKKGPGVREKQIGEAAARALSQTILPTSATMIGVCATLIGLVKIVEGQAGKSHVDEYAALVLVVFLASSLISYLSLREPGRFGDHLEFAADMLFVLGLIAISAVSFVFAYEII